MPVTPTQVVDPKTLLTPPPGYAVASRWLAPAARTMPLDTRIAVDAIDFTNVTLGGGLVSVGKTQSDINSVVSQLQAGIAGRGSTFVAAALLRRTEVDVTLPPWVPIVGGRQVARLERYRLVVGHKFVQLLFAVGLVLVLGYFVDQYLKGNPNAPALLRQACDLFGLSCAIKAATNLLAVYVLLGGVTSIGAWLVIRAATGEKPPPPKPPKLPSVTGRVGARVGPLQAAVGARS